MTSEQYIVDQDEWLRITGLKIGDEVKIIAEPANGGGYPGCGWDDSWPPNAHVGDTGKVISVGKMTEGIHVGSPNGHWYYPFFVLVKI